MESVYTGSELSGHANNMPAFGHNQNIDPSTTPEFSPLLNLPGELRNAIWVYCLQLGDDVEIAIMARSMISCKGGLRTPGIEPPTTLAPKLLQTNKQIRKEGRAIMCNCNKFSIVLNQASYLGCVSKIPLRVSVARDDLASIPSRWTSDIKNCVHQMRRLTLYVTLNREYESLHTSSRMLLEDKKSEVAAIVGTALGELCEILSLSKNLASFKVQFLDLGAEQLKTGSEHKVLECLGQLKGLKHVEICGTPKGAKEYLEKVMTFTKRNEEARKVIVLSRIEKNWGAPY